MKITAFEASRVLATFFFVHFPDAPAVVEDKFLFIPATFLSYTSTPSKVGARVTAIAIYHLPEAVQESIQPLLALDQSALDQSTGQFD